jgi:hypothetical protein
MAATTSGAIKAFVESLGLGLAGYRGKKPAGERLARWFEVHEDISTVPDGAWNAHDDPEGHVSELAQVDLYQLAKNPVTGLNSEVYTLPDALMAGLHGARLPAAPKHVSTVLVVSRNRVPDPDANVIHHALTVQVRRTLV